MGFVVFGEQKKYQKTHIFLEIPCVIFGTFGNNAYLCNVNIKQQQF
jgi:hypothetical protein